MKTDPAAGGRRASGLPGRPVRASILKNNYVNEANYVSFLIHGSPLVLTGLQNTIKINTESGIISALE
jgi:hypothetical protein